MSSDILGIPNPIKIVGGLLGGAAKTVAGSVFAELAKLVVQALNQTLASMATLWVNVGTPNLTTETGGSRPSASVAYIQGHLWFLMTAAAVMGVIVGCGRMVWEQRADAGRDVLRGLVVYVLVTGAGLAAISLAVQAADGFSAWIISGAVAEQGFGGALTELIGLTSAGTNALGLLLVILFGLLALMASVIQIVLMVIRGGMLVLLAGVLPTCASFTGTQAGRQWFRKAIGWLVAFILYKPAAAIVYATAIRLASAGVFGSGGVVGVITGLTLMLVALLALPALMRFVVPMVGAVASGGAGAMLAAGAGAAAVAMPSGAVRAAGAVSGGAIARGGGGSAGGGGEGSPARPDPSGSAPVSGGGAAPSSEGSDAAATTSRPGGSGGGAVALPDTPAQATSAHHGSGAGASSAPPRSGAVALGAGSGGAGAAGAGAGSGPGTGGDRSPQLSAAAPLAPRSSAARSAAVEDFGDRPPGATAGHHGGVAAVVVSGGVGAAEGAVSGLGSDGGEPTGANGGER